MGCSSTIAPIFLTVSLAYPSSGRTIWVFPSKLLHRPAVLRTRLLRRVNIERRLPDKHLNPAAHSGPIRQTLNSVGFGMIFGFSFDLHGGARPSRQLSEH